MIGYESSEADQRRYYYSENGLVLIRSWICCESSRARHQPTGVIRFYDSMKNYTFQAIQRRLVEMNRNFIVIL